MSQVLINQYLAQLDVLKKVGGTHRESVVREAFKDLLKGWGKQHDLVFIPEYRLDTATRDIRTVDGALLHELRFCRNSAKRPSMPVRPAPIRKPASRSGSLQTRIGL